VDLLEGIQYQEILHSEIHAEDHNSMVIEMILLEEEETIYIWR